MSSHRRKMEPYFNKDVSGGWLRLLVLLLYFAGDVRGKDRLQPRSRAAPANPRMRGCHGTSKASGKSGSSKGKAVVPFHGRMIRGKEKCAMRKLKLAKGYALRILCACPTLTKSSLKRQSSSCAKSTMSAAHKSSRLCKQEISRSGTNSTNSSPSG